MYHEENAAFNWHRCGRWIENGLKCPFTGEGDDEVEQDDEDEDEDAGPPLPPGKKLLQRPPRLGDGVRVRIPELVGARRAIEARPPSTARKDIEAIARKPDPVRLPVRPRVPYTRPAARPARGPVRQGVRSNATNPANQRSTASNALSTRQKKARLAQTLPVYRSFQASGGPPPNVAENLSTARVAESMLAREVARGRSRSRGTERGLEGGDEAKRARARGVEEAEGIVRRGAPQKEGVFSTRQKVALGIAAGTGVAAVIHGMRRGGRGGGFHSPAMKFRFNSPLFAR